MFCCTLRFVNSSFAIIKIGKIELVALLSLSSLRLVIVLWLFLALPWVCLQFVNVEFPDHNHLLYVVPNRIKSYLTKKAKILVILETQTMLIVSWMKTYLNT